MLRHETSADRAGALVAERVRGLIEAAQGRADRVRRDAEDEAQGLDRRRMKAASRIVAEVEKLEAGLERVRREMRSEHTVEGSFVEEERQIEGRRTRARGTAPTRRTDVSAPEAEAARAEAEEPAPLDAAEAEEPAPLDVVEDDAGPEHVEDSVPDADVDAEAEPSPEEDDAQRTRFSFRRRRDRADEPSGPSAEDPEPADHASGPQPFGPPAAATTSSQQVETHVCDVCGRGLAGGEDDLKSLGWVISPSGEIACADCHGAGWLGPSG